MVQLSGFPWKYEAISFINYAEVTKKKLNIEVPETSNWLESSLPPTPPSYSAAVEITNKIYSTSFPMTLNTWNMVPHLNIIER